MDVPSMLKRAAEKANLTRIKYSEKNIPTDPSNIVILPFFGSERCGFVLASFLLRRYREQIKGSKYFILISWPGDESLYPFVDEYWTTSADMHGNIDNFSNTSTSFNSMMRSLNYFFEDVIDPKIFEEYYNQGIRKEYLDKFKFIEKTIPAVASSVSSLGLQVGRQLMDVAGKSVFFAAEKKIRAWHYRKTEELKIPPDFWIQISKKLIENDITPIVWLKDTSYDISKDVTDKCIYFQANDAGKVLTAMRTSGCVLDMFTGISRLAILARCPFVACDERDRYYGTKEYELDDLFAGGIPREYLFSFSAIVTRGNKDDWGPNLIKPVISKIQGFLPTLDRDSWPALSEVREKVDLSIVRKHKAIKLGTRFIKMKRK